LYENKNWDLGLGGVGGYFEDYSKLILNQMQSNRFYCTWRNPKANAKNGLKIIADTTEIVAFPSLVSNVPEEIGKLDLPYLRH
jgi:2-dehydropantoate 2-reductase